MDKAAQQQQQAGFLGLSPALLNVYLNVALYALAYQAQTPVRPFLVKSLSEDARMSYAYLTSFMSALQLVGSLLAGVLVDRLGARSVLLLSYGASAVSYAVTAASNDLPTLYASQLPTVLQHAVIGARSFIVLSTASDAARATQIGYVGVAYGAGAVIGPALGGFLAQYSLRSSAVVAAALSAVSFLVTLLLPSASPAAAVSAPPPPSAAGKAAAGGNKGRAAAAAAAAPAGEGAPGGSSWATYGKIASSPVILSLLLVKAAFFAATSLFHSVFALVGAERFGLDAEATGLLMSYVGFLGMVTQAFIVHPVVARFSEHSITLASAAILTACFGAFAVVETLPQLYALCVPLVVVTSVFMLVNTAQIARAAPAEGKGTLVAVDMAIGSGMRMAAPLVGGALLNRFGFPSIGAVSSVAMGTVALLLSVGAVAADAKSHELPAATAAAKASTHLQ